MKEKRKIFMLMALILGALAALLTCKKSYIGRPKKQGFYERVIKHPQDVCLALVAILILSPLMGVIALLIRCKLGSPVLFAQEIPGLYGIVFKLYKFRTMTEVTDENGNLLQEELHVTKLGQFLRETSLDEMPELFNILKGDMSLVGPRPLPVQYLPHYNEKQVRRHLVRPGVTGYAQVYGRKEDTWEERLKKDVYYVEHISFLLDWRILIKHQNRK